MIRDEADRAHQHGRDTPPVQGDEVIEDVRPEPRLTGRGLALERERPLAQPCALRYERGGLEQLVRVRVAVVENSRRQRVRREDHVCVEIL